MSGGQRLVLDVSSLARWAGPPGGIVRVEQQLLHSGPRHVVPAVFDPDRGEYRSLTPAWRDAILGDRAALVLSDGPLLARHGWRAAAPRRGDVWFALEHLRLSSPPAVARVVDWIERALAELHPHSIQLLTATGERFSYVPESLALGDAIDLAPGDVVLSVGYDWLRKTPDQVARLKQDTGIRYVVTCYDMIPVLFPDFYTPPEVQGFARFWEDMLGVADRVLAISKRTRDDLVAWAEAQQLTVPDIAVVPLGSGIGAPGAAVDERLPDGLTPGKYVLMVGTIEPRKGHRLLLDVWHALLARGIPQRAGYVLVLAGKRGWMTDELCWEIEQAQGPHLMHLDKVWDGRLERLYRDAAFVVLPSIYEGFGLPVIEAFSHGKAVIASTGGALPEVVGDLSPCLDPIEPAPWQALLEQWILNPEARAVYETRIATSFTRPDWANVANAFWTAACGDDRMRS